MGTKDSHYNRLRAETVERARWQFRHHRLIEEGEGRWYFRNRNGSNNYSFHLVAAPGMVAMYGDIGELMLLPYGGRALDWLRGVMDRRADCISLEYVAEKVSRDMSVKEFQPELITEFVAELRAEAEQDRARNVPDEEEDVVDEDLDEEEEERLDDDEEEEEEPEETNRCDLLASHIEAYEDGYNDACAFDSASEFYRYAFYENPHDDVPHYDEPPSVEGLSFWFHMRVQALWHFCRALDRTEMDPLDYLITVPEQNE